MELDVYKEWLGIPEGPRPPDHYQLLRLVQFEDAVDKIRANYKKLNAHVRKYASGQYSIKSQELLNELAKAMLCLTDADRKRDYDESLGREFEVEKSVFGGQNMDTWLLEHKHVSQGQLKEARAHADRTGLQLRDALVQMKIVDASIAAQALACELGLSYVDLSEMLPDDTVLDRVPKSLVKQHSILPLFIDNDVVLIACADQVEHEVEEELRLRFDLPIRSVLTTPLAISQAITKYYAPGLRKEPTETKSSAASGKKGSAAAPVRRVTVKTPLTDEQKAERKKLGWVAIGFACPAAYLLRLLLGNHNAIGSDVMTYVLFLGVPVVTFVIVTQTLWKK